MRQKLDFYETAPWQTRALIDHQPIHGTILEPCAGDGSIVGVFAQYGIEVTTNDIDPDRKADFHVDASDPDLYLNLKPDWVVTNPPYEMPLCRDIVEQAVKHAKIGVAMMLRISFREPTAKKNPRGPFLAANPISRLLTLPRYSFIGNGKSDSATTEWVIWLKQPEKFNHFPPILSLYNADELYA